MGLLDFFNTRVEEEENTEGIQGRLSSLLSLSKEEELIKLKNKWISDWESFEGKKKIEERQKENEKYWLGDHFINSQKLTGNVEPIDNLVFESLEEALPIYTRQIAEPNIKAGEDPQIKQITKKVADKIYDIADVIRLRLKIKKVVRYWALYHLGILKIGWSNAKNEIMVQAVRPQDLILDPEAITDECEYQGDYIGHYRTDTADNLIGKFPKAKKEISGLVGKEEGTKIKYIEWWTEEFLFWTMKDIVLDKAKNPHWNYEEKTEMREVDENGGEVLTPQIIKGVNHFSSPKMPFVFLSVFSLGKSPYDETGLIEQVIPLQDKLNKRTRQIDKNADRTNGGIVVSAEYFSKEQTSEVADALAEGDRAIRVPGDINRAYKRDMAPPLPQFIYQDMVDSRNEIRGIFGVTGLSAQGIKSEETVRGKILVRGQDTDRSSLIIDHIEQFYDYVFNWFVQMMLVYYKDQRPISGTQGESISAEEMSFPMVVSVKEGSLIPKDRLTQRNEAIDLWSKNALDPITLYEKLEFPDPQQAARNLFLWLNNPISLFPDLAQEQQIVQQQALQVGVPQMGVPPQKQGRESLLSAVPIQ